MNDTTGPESLCPTVLVFGTIPRSARSFHSAKKFERARAREQAMDEIIKENARKKLATAERHTHSPKGLESIASLS